MSVATPDSEVTAEAPPPPPPPPDPIHQLKWRWLFAWYALSVAVSLGFFRDNEAIGDLLESVPAFAFFALSRPGRAVAWRLTSTRTPLRVLGVGALVGALTWTFELSRDLTGLSIIGAADDFADVFDPVAPGHLPDYVLITPLVEEFLFRGVLLNRLAPRVGIRWAIALSALAFGVPHGSEWSSAMLVGGIWACLYVTTGSVWPGVAAHATHNLLAATGGLGAGPGLAQMAGTAPAAWLLASSMLAGLLGAVGGATWPAKGTGAPYYRRETSSIPNEESA